MGPSSRCGRGGGQASSVGSERGRGGGKGAVRVVSGLGGFLKWEAGRASLHVRSLPVLDGASRHRARRNYVFEDIESTVALFCPERRLARQHVKSMSPRRAGLQLQHRHGEKAAAAAAAAAVVAAWSDAVTSTARRHHRHRGLGSAGVHAGQGRSPLRGRQLRLDGGQAGSDAPGARRLRRWHDQPALRGSDAVLLRASGPRAG